MDRKNAHASESKENIKELYQEKALRLAIINSDERLKEIFQKSQSLIPNFSTRLMHKISFYDFEYKQYEYPFKRYEYSDANLVRLHEKLDNLYYAKNEEQFREIFTEEFFNSQVFSNITSREDENDYRINKLRF